MIEKPIRYNVEGILPIENKKIPLINIASISVIKNPNGELTLTAVDRNKQISDWNFENSAQLIAFLYRSGIDYNQINWTNLQDNPSLEDS